ncbi:MAG TPA: copper chaperone PCu(A)C [Tahibacter sp.]|nr:copper chaperone PCu(A)C [Tahibacter sp.]
MLCRYALLIVSLVSLPAAAAGKLVVDDAWIRAAPPGVRMLAGYARLTNAGDAPLVVTGATSAAFGDVSLHASAVEDGVAKMRPLPRLTIAPGATETLAPGGKHLMLMQPAATLEVGAKATITLTVEGGGDGTAEFVVRDGAPEAEGSGHAHHDH